MKQYNLAIAIDHGFAIMAGKDFGISTTLERTGDGYRDYLILDHANATWRHDVQYASGFGRQLHGAMADLDRHLADGSWRIAPAWRAR